MNLIPALTVGEHPHASDRVVIISDTHFGRPHAAARSAVALRPVWRGASQLIINGDVAEVHHPKHWSKAARMTLQLHDCCEADDVKLTLISGNHDPYISDIRHYWLASMQVLVTHGDVLHPAVAPWSPVAGRIKQAYQFAYDAAVDGTRSHLERRLQAAQHAAANVEIENMAREAGRSSIFGMLVRPWAIARVLWYWRTFPRLAAKFMNDHAPDSRFAVIGHTHFPGVWHVSQRVIINTGSFGFPGSPLAVVVEPGSLTVWPIEYKNEEYRLAAKPKASFELATTGSESSTVSGKHSAG